MNQVVVLFRQNVLLFLQSKSGVLMAFIVPILIIALFGSVFGLYGRRDPRPIGVPLAVVNLSEAPAARKLVTALGQEKSFRVISESQEGNAVKRSLTEAEVRVGLRDNRYRYALILPADLVSETEFGLRMKFLSDPRNEIEAQMVNGLLMKTIFSSVPELLGQALQLRSKKLLGDKRLEAFNRAIANAAVGAFGGSADEVYGRIVAGDFGLDQLSASSPLGTANSADNRSADGFLSRIVKLEREQVTGKQVSNPMASRLIGGYGIMFLLFALSGAATAVYEEKKTGIYHRLLSAPVTPSHILLARFLFGVALGTVQLSVLFVAGRFLFGVEVFSHAGTLLAMIVSAAAACTAFGMLIAAVCSSREAAMGLATLLVLSMSSIGGAWFPVSMMPETIQVISKLTFVYWSVDGFISILWAGKTIASLWPTFAILLGTAAVVMTFSTWWIRRRNLID